MDHCLLSTLPPCPASLAQGPCPPPDEQEAVCPPSEHRSTCAVPGTQHAMRPAASAHRNGTFPPSRMDGAAWESWPAPHPLHLQPLELQQPWLGGHRSSARCVFSHFLLISARRPARGGRSCETQRRWTGLPGSSQHFNLCIFLASSFSFHYFSLMK